MFLRVARLPVLIVLAAVGAIAVAGLAGVGVAAGSSSHQRLLLRCAKQILGEGGVALAAPATAYPQSADFSIFRVTRTSEDRLPSARSVARALKGSGAVTYNPSASVRLSVPGSQSGTIYAVPVTLAVHHVPARCMHLSALAGLRASLALRAQDVGTGPGICLISVQVEPAGRPISVLPGQRRRGPTGTTTLANAGCESLTVISGYMGALGGGLSSVGVHAVLVPDGISSLTDTFAGGRQVTTPVSGNLAIAPTADTPDLPLHKLTRARLIRGLNAFAPLTITESSAAGSVVATLTRPPSLIPELVREVLLFKKSFSGTFSSGSESDGQVIAACSARTHRCVAAVVTTKCSDRSRRCTLSRRVARYRYATRRPPRGTTGNVNVPTAPIRARASAYFTHPGKLTLTLSGTPRSRVDVLVGATCFFRHGSGGARGVGRQPLVLTVPSRTTIAAVPRDRKCDVNVLVMSSQPGPIHATLASG
jgi:hypothetical protein